MKKEEVDEFGFEKENKRKREVLREMKQTKKRINRINKKLRKKGYR